METLFYFIAFIAFLLSVYNFFSVRRLRGAISDTKDSIQNSVSWAKEDLRNDIGMLRNLLKIQARGGKLTAEMIDEGKPFIDMSAAEAQSLLNESPTGVVIDVRTPSEYMAGHIPGARLIPIEEIESRIEEIQRSAQPIFVVCQGGTRSAAACEILSQSGFVNLINIYDGTPSWPGKKELGVAIRPPASAMRQ